MKDVSATRSRFYIFFLKVCSKENYLVMANLIKERKENKKSLDVHKNETLLRKTVWL